MQKIVLYLDYQCYPMWIYSENNELIDNNIIDELKENTLIINKLNELQGTYDSLFKDDANMFEFLGFPTEKERKAFLHLSDEVFCLLLNELEGIYMIENKITI